MGTWCFPFKRNAGYGGRYGVIGMGAAKCRSLALIVEIGFGWAIQSDIFLGVAAAKPSTLRHLNYGYRT